MRLIKLNRLTVPVVPAVVALALVGVGVAVAAGGFASSSPSHRTAPAPASSPPAGLASSASPALSPVASFSAPAPASSFASVQGVAAGAVEVMASPMSASPSVTVAPKPTVLATPKPAATTPAPKKIPVPPKKTAPPAPKVVPPAPAPAPAGGKPGATNTGVPAGTKLTVHSGDLTVTTAGQVIDSLDIKGVLTIRASNVVVRRSLIEGRNGSDSVIIKSGSGILLEDDEVTVVSPSPASDDMSVQGATLDRLNIHGGVDGMKLGANSTVEASWIHGLSSFNSDPAQGGGPTHNDTIQIMSGTNIHVTGNNLQATEDDNSAIQVTQDTGTVSALTISHNWADGGACTFNFSGHGPDGQLFKMSGISVIDNRFGRDSQYGCPMLVDLQTTITQSGNVYDNNGEPIEIQRHN
jgi:hypothetical protein